MNITFLELLTILFIGLKLTNYINWSWFIVLMPLYGSFVFIFTMAFLGGCIILIEKLFLRFKK